MINNWPVLSVVCGLLKKKLIASFIIKHIAVIRNIEATKIFSDLILTDKTHYQTSELKNVRFTF